MLRDCTPKTTIAKMIAAPKKIPKKAMMNVKSLDMVKTAINGFIRSVDCESMFMGHPD